ncbi:uncharacterized protein LOC102716029 [Oryza brachyantha]|uniref:uncharacterized protein LOC102716029 n=1 Tax=Oryza brachyantha TaxID=4533 RepID=UPI001AD979C8|nr:uncharacterized protein LOC102716029 [Oryza brachyantha]
MEAKAIVAAAVLSTLLLPLFLSQRPRAAVVHLSLPPAALPASATALLEACSRLLDLLTRRNIILLCNAILLIVLRDAGLLACPAARRDGDHASRSAAAAASSPVAATSAAAPPHRRPHAAPPSDIVVWRPARVAVVDVLHVDAGNDDGDRLTRHRRPKGREPATAPYAAPPPAPEENQSYHCLGDHVSAGAIVVVEDANDSPVFDSDHHHSTGEDTHDDAEAHDQFDDDDKEARDHCGGGDDHDVDEMNRRFEEFIINTKRKMQLESLQLQLIMKV